MRDTTSSPPSSQPGSVAGVDTPAPEADATHSATGSPCCSPHKEDLHTIGGHIKQNDEPPCAPLIVSAVEPEQIHGDKMISSLENGTTCGGEPVSVQDVECSSNDDSSFELLNDTLNADGEDIFRNLTFPTPRRSAALYSRSVSSPVSYPTVPQDDYFHLLEDCLDSDHSRVSATEDLSSEMLVDGAKVSGDTLAEKGCSAATEVEHDSKHSEGDSTTGDNGSSYPPVQVEGKETSTCLLMTCDRNSTDELSLINCDSSEDNVHEIKTTSNISTFDFPDECKDSPCPESTHPDWKTSEVFPLDSCKESSGTDWGDLRTTRLRMLAESETVSCYHDCHSRRVSESDYTHGEGGLHGAPAHWRTDSKELQINREHLEKDDALCSIGDGDNVAIAATQDANSDIDGFCDSKYTNGDKIPEKILISDGNETGLQIGRSEDINGYSDYSKFPDDRANVSLDPPSTNAVENLVEETDTTSSVKQDSSGTHPSIAAPTTLSGDDINHQTRARTGPVSKDSTESSPCVNSSHEVHIASDPSIDRGHNSERMQQLEIGRIRRRKEGKQICGGSPPHGICESPTISLRDDKTQSQTKSKNTGVISGYDGSDACIGANMATVATSRSAGSGSILAGDYPSPAAEVVPERKRKKSKKRSNDQKLVEDKQSSPESVINRKGLKLHINDTKFRNSYENGKNSPTTVGIGSSSPRIINSKDCGHVEVPASVPSAAPSKSKAKPPTKTWRRSMREAKGQCSPPARAAPAGSATPTSGTSAPNWRKLLKFLQNMDTKRGHGKRIKRWKSAENLYQQSYEEDNNCNSQRKAVGDSNNRGLNKSSSSATTANDGLQRREGSGSPGRSGGDSPLNGFGGGLGSSGKITDKGPEFSSSGKTRKESKSDKKKSSGHKNDTKKVTKSSSKSDKKDSNRDSRSSNSSSNSNSSKKGKERKGNSSEDSKGNTDSEDNRQRSQAPPSSRSVGTGYGVGTGLDVPPQKLYSTQLDPGVYARNEHLLNRQFSTPSAATNQFSLASHKGHNSSSQISSGGATSASTSHKPPQFSSSLSSNCLSAQDRTTGPNHGFHASHSTSQLPSVGQHLYQGNNSSNSQLNGDANELNSSGHVSGDLASSSTTTTGGASQTHSSTYNNRDIPEENSPCLSPVSANAPTTWEDALDSDSNLVRYGDETEGIQTAGVGTRSGGGHNHTEDGCARNSGGMDNSGCESRTMTQGGEQHSFSSGHNSSTRSTSSASNNPNGDRYSAGHQIRRCESSTSSHNSVHPLNCHSASSEIVTGEPHDSGAPSPAVANTSFHSVNLSTSSTATQDTARENRSGGGSLQVTDYHSVAPYGGDNNSWDFGGGNDSVSSEAASVAVVSPWSGGFNIPGQDANLSSRLCSNSRTPSPRPPAAPPSGGESGGDETQHVAGGHSLDGESRSSESTRSLSFVSSSKEKSQQLPILPDKDKKTKKAWYNVLNPTYKSRSEDLKRLFKDLPSDERLIVDYSCALQKDILVHGRLYVTSNYFCFYSKIFGWETLLSIQCKDIISMTKEKTALVIPNAIQITTDGEKNFFTTFAARDKTYLMLFRIWQNALMDQQMLASELWQWVHSCYGDELGLTSDDDDYVAPSTTEDDQRNNNSNGHDKGSHVPLSSHLTAGSSSSSSGGRGLGGQGVTSSAPSVGGETASSPPSVLGPGGDSGGDVSNDVSQSDNADSTNSGTLTRGVPAPEPSDNHTSSSSSSVAAPPCHPAETPAPRPAPKHSPTKSSRLSSKHSSPAKSVTGAAPALEDSDTPDSEDLSSKQSAGGASLEAVVCPNQQTHHTGREIINKNYAIPIDALFTLLFTNSKMMLDVHTARKTTDVLASPWQSKEDTQQRLRQVTYTVALPTNSFGPKVSHVTETQVMSELTVPGEYYSIDAEASNAGIPYADSFLVSNHWCLTRETANDTRLVVWTSVKYKKSMWGFMKGVIDKNACSGVECLLADIDTALQREVAQQSDLRQRTRRRRRRPTTKMADTEPGSGASPAAAPGGGGGQQAGPTTVLGKESKPVKEPKQAVTNAVTRILGAPVNPLSSHRHLPAAPALQAVRATKPSSSSSPPAAAETTSYGGGIKLVAGALLLLLLTNMLLYWRLWHLEAIVRGQPTLGGVRGLLDIDPALLRKGVGGALGEAWLHVLQDQEAAHSRQVEGWRDQVAEAASLLNQAEGVLRGLHSTIPEQHAASVRALLARLRSLDQQHTLAHDDNQPRHLQHTSDPPHPLQGGGGDGPHHTTVTAGGMNDDDGGGERIALPNHRSHFDHHDHLDDDNNHMRQQPPDNVANVAS